MTQFIRTARQVRQFPLAEGTPPRQLLEHLNLLNEGRLTNAAVLLFGTQPQRFLICSEIRCAHFHGTEVGKPIPSYQVYKGTGQARSFERVLNRLLSEELLEMSVPDRPRSPAQRNGVMAKGRPAIASIGETTGSPKHE